MQMIWWVVSLFFVLVGLLLNIVGFIDAVGDWRMMREAKINGAYLLFANAQVRRKVLMIICQSAFTIILVRRWWHFDDPPPTVSALAFLTVMFCLVYDAIVEWRDRFHLRWLMTTTRDHGVSK